MAIENIINEAMSEDALRAMLTGQLAQIADIIDAPDSNTIYIGLRKPNPTDAEIASDAIWAFIKIVTNIPSSLNDEALTILYPINPRLIISL